MQDTVGINPGLWACLVFSSTTELHKLEAGTYPADAEGEDDGQQLYRGDAHHCPDDDVQVLLDIVGELVEAALHIVQYS